VAEPLCSSRGWLFHSDFHNHQTGKEAGMGVNNAARKNLSGFLTVALMAALLLAPSIGYAQQVNLVFRQSDPPASAKGLETALEEFGRNNPNIKVKYEIVPWKDALQQFIRETAVVMKMGDVATTDTLW
jgi:ABC-type glycerol-3-phosphate transport system substrate-binding protein